MHLVWLYFCLPLDRVLATAKAAIRSFEIARGAVLLEMEADRPLEGEVTLCAGPATGVSKQQILYGPAECKLMPGRNILAWGERLFMPGFYRLTFRAHGGSLQLCSSCEYGHGAAGRAASPSGTRSIEGDAEPAPGEERRDSGSLKANACDRGFCGDKAGVLVFICLGTAIMLLGGYLILRK